MKAPAKKLAGLVLLLSLLAVGSLTIPFPKERMNPAPIISLHILDRNNLLLREVLSDEGGRCRWVGLADISPLLILATIAAEDKHFFFHSGVSLQAMARAVLQNLRHRRIVSGASTISQQLVRNMSRRPRNLMTKIWEVWLALRLERTLSKEEILVQYINRISYSNLAYGIEAASLLYFDKPALHLSLAESAFLAALPRSPSILNPFRGFAEARKRQRDILQKMLELGFITKDEWERAAGEKISLSSVRERFRAPHFCDYILRQLLPEKRRNLSAIRTTLDLPLQEKMETLVTKHIHSSEKKGITNGAIVILDNATGEILSMVGSKDFFDDSHDGQINGALALRQPGSTLKPFTYGLALEKGMTAASIVDDIQMDFPTPEGSYMPHNYDRKFRGSVRLRSALACSLNVPAVSILQDLGPDMLYQRLRMLRFDSLKESPGFYGLGLTLGNGEVSLLELTQAYSSLARGGLMLKETSILEIDGKDPPFSGEEEPKRIFSPQVSYIISHILSDKDARIPSFGFYSPLSLPFPAAAKTGTSKDYRDNWTVGFTPDYTVGVWVGNFDGKPMHHVSGIAGCGPLFRDIMLVLYERKPWPAFQVPENIITQNVCSLSGKLPGTFCEGAIEEVFVKGTEPTTVCSLHAGKMLLAKPTASREEAEKMAVAISFPKEGDIFKIDPVLRQEYQTIRLRATISHRLNAGSLEWWINGEKAASVSSPYSFRWNLKPGFYTILARAKTGSHSIDSRPVRIHILS